MYFKQWQTVLFVQKSDSPEWVRWVHQSEGYTHCDECLMLDGCLFLRSKAPPWPHHPNCHCILEPVDYAVVQISASTYSDYRKFDPYLFNTQNQHPHGKDKLFKQWGYTVEDARWLQAEIERQGLEKYLSGEYILGKLNEKGQRISIRVTILRRDTGEAVSFTTGWMICPKGTLKLCTPYGGK